MRARWLGVSAACVIAAGGLGVATPAVAAVACPVGVESDFNGDGHRDVVIADPEATVAGHTDVSAVHFFRLNASTTATQTAGIDQNTDGMEGEAETGDFFGQQLTTVNSALNATSTATTTRVVIGAPGEEWQQEDLEKGGVQIVPMADPPGVDDHRIDPGYSVGDVVGPHMYTGLSLGSTPSLLYVGVPYGEPGARTVHEFSWNVTSGGGSTVSYEPGTGDIPAGGKTFGTVVR